MKTKPAIDSPDAALGTPFLLLEGPLDMMGEKKIPSPRQSVFPTELDFTARRSPLIGLWGPFSLSHAHSHSYSHSYSHSHPHTHWTGSV